MQQCETSALFSQKELQKSKATTGAKETLAPLIGDSSGCQPCAALQRLCWPAQKLLIASNIQVDLENAKFLIASNIQVDSENAKLLMALNTSALPKGLFCCCLNRYSCHTIAPTYPQMILSES